MAVLARRAVPQVRRVLPDWPGGLVVEVPGVRGRPRRRAGHASRAVPRDRRRHHDRGRVPRAARPEPRLRQPPRLPAAQAARGAGGDHPRGHPRRHERGHQPRADLAGRGLRRLRRPALPAAAGLPRPRPASSRWSAAAGARRTCPGARSSPPARRTSRRATRAPGSPAGCSPATVAPARWSAFYRAVDAGGRSAPSCGGTSASAPPPHPAVAEPPVTLAGVSERRVGPGHVPGRHRRLRRRRRPASSRGTPCRAGLRLRLRRVDVFTPGPDRPGERLQRPGPPSRLGVTGGLAAGHPGPRSDAHRADASPAGCAAGGGCGCSWPSLALAVVGRLVTLPFAIVGHHRSVEYGLSTRGLGALGGRPAQGPGALGRHLRPAAARAGRAVPAGCRAPGRPWRGLCSAAW